MVENGAGKLMRRGCSTHVACSQFTASMLALQRSRQTRSALPFGDDIIDGLRYAIGMDIKAKMSQKH